MIFEDDDLLVVNKPAGWNTHSPAPHAGEGTYEWFRNREPRWASLAILHRLDKETSGVLVFGKTPVANRSLAAQFTEHQVRKSYVFLSDRQPQHSSWTVKNKLVRIGSRYAEATRGQKGELAETRFKVQSEFNGTTSICAQPVTGRTHQIRVHAAQSGVPVLGDELYGGSGFQRACLHAESIYFTHPQSNRRVSFKADAKFEQDARLALRAAVMDESATNAFRLIHGAADGWPGWYVDRLGDHLLSQSELELDETRLQELQRLMACTKASGAYHKLLSRQVRRTTPGEACPQLVLGSAAPESFQIRESGLSFELSFQEGYSTGLFLDQRDNRRRLITGHVAPEFKVRSAQSQTTSMEVLNTFAYTCGFSVCAARAGARVTSLDLSRKYLDWGRRNFETNELNPTQHDFIYGDAFDWMKRLKKKGRRFDLIILDPPTFSQSKQSGAFRVEQDFGALVRAAADLLNSEGRLLASSNSARWPVNSFLHTVRAALRSNGCQILKEHYQPQPPDFPVTREEPAYLKTAWFGIG